MKKDLSNTQHNLNITRQMNRYFLYLAVGIIIVCTLSLGILRFNLKENLHKQNLYFVENVTGFIEERFDNIESALNRLARLPLNTNNADGNIGESITLRNHLTEIISVMPDVTTVAEADMDGHYIRIPYIPATSERLKGFDPRTRPWFKHAANDTDDVFYTAPYKDYVTKRDVVTISQAILRSDSSQTGVISFDIDLDTLRSSLNSFRTAVIGNVIVVDDEYSTAFGGHSHIDEEEVTELQRVAKARKGVIYLEKYDAYYYFKKIQHPSWTVVFKIESRDLNNYIYDTFFFIISFVTLIMLLLILACFWWGMNGKLNALSMRIAMGIRQGTFDTKSESELLLNEINSVNDSKQQLVNDSRTDSLTGLKNRRAFDEVMPTMVGQAQNLIALIDIDNFKLINDTYGHAVGDLVLKVVASLGEGQMHAGNIAIYRYGGEEIAVLFKGMAKAEARTLLDDWRINVATREFREMPSGVTFSAGLCDMSASTVTDVITAADKLLYQAKKAGKNQIVLG